MIPPFVGCVWFDFRILAEGDAVEYRDISTLN